MANTITINGNRENWDNFDPEGAAAYNELDAEADAIVEQIEELRAKVTLIQRRQRDIVNDARDKFNGV